MNKKLQSLTSKRYLTDFSEKLAAKWSLGVQATAPSKLREHESTEDILRDLVAMPTTTGNAEACREAFDYIETFLKKHKLYVHRYEWNGVESLVATTQKTKTPTIFLTGHIDVVPAEEHMFNLEVTDEKYIGRGVLDMKGALAAYLGAIQQLGETAQDLDFGILITSDEEVGGYDGAEKLIEEGYIPQAIVLMDGGSNWSMEEAAKGIFWMSVTAGGFAAHASRPWEGDSAIEKLIKALQEIRALTPVTGSPEDNSINIGTIQGGDATNQIPASATATIDVRTISLEDHKRLHHEIAKIVDKYHLTLTIDIEGLPMKNNPAHPLLATFASLLAKHTGQPTTWIKSNAGSDGRFFAAKGVQCAITYPRGAGHHSSGEWIGKETLQQMQDLFVAYLKEVAKK